MTLETAFEQKTNTQKQVTINVVAAAHELLPTYASLGAAGADLRAHISQDIIIPPGNAALVPTGLKVELPIGYELQIRPRVALHSKIRSQYSTLPALLTVTTEEKLE